MIRGLIFDLDGTLCFTEEANFAAYRRAFADVGAVLERQAYADAFGLRFDAMVQRVCPGLTPEQTRHVREAKAGYYRESLHLVQPNTALIAFLRSMRGHHVTGLVTTAARHNALAVLEHVGLVDAFDHALFGEDVRRAKPDPECYNGILQRAGLEARECLAFEDSELGIAAAEAAGISVVRVVAP